MIYIGFAYGGHGVCYCMFVKAFQTRVVNSYFCIVIGQRYNLILHETKDKRNVNRARYIESYLLSLFDIPNTCTDTCTQLLRSSYHIQGFFKCKNIFTFYQLVRNSGYGQLQIYSSIEHINPNFPAELRHLQLSYGYSVK